MMAGEDKDLLTELGRSKTPTDLAKRVKDLRTELSKRPAAAKAEPLAKDATPEQVADWRKANGVPEKSADYGNALALPAGIVLGEADRPIAESFFTAAHEAGLPQPAVNAALDWYFRFQEQQEIARRDADTTVYDKTLGELRQEWGAADFQRNTNAIGAVVAPIINKQGEGLFDQLVNARLPDGTRLGDHAGVTRALVDLALEINPVARTTPADAANSRKSIGSRMEEIKALMSGPDANEKYWGNEAVQKEYRDLLAAEERLGGRRVA
jgi:hypothetical protein